MNLSKNSSENLRTKLNILNICSIGLMGVLVYFLVEMVQKGNDANKVLYVVSLSAIIVVFSAIARKMQSEIKSRK